jgi:CYTH domain-containing protein
VAVARRFLIASSLTRLVRKERGSERVIEGHFPAQGGRQSHVRIEKGQCQLVLTALDHEVAGGEDRTEVPRSHAEALLEVAPGTVTYERSRLRLRNHEALIDRFITPGPLDLVTVEFAARVDADTFLPPVWFGSEVTDDDSYSNRMMAIVGKPRAPEAPLSNAALESMLDLLESRSDETSYAPVERPLERPAERQVEDNPFERLRRIAAARPAAPSAQPETEPVQPAAPAAPVDTVEPPKANEAVAPFRRRRPTVQTAVAAKPEADGDDRLAGVIQGLSEALAQASPPEKDERFGA